MADNSPRVAGVILAAGLSSRLGRPKQLLDFGGEPLVRRVARVALMSRLNPVIVVVGNAADQIAPRLDDLNVAIALNPDFASGQASSLKAGIRAIPQVADAVLFLLGDQPTIEPEVIDAVIDEYGTSGADIVQARYGGDTAGHPVLFSRRLIPELMNLEGDEGGRSIIRSLGGAVQYVDFDQMPPPDIDTESDYQRVLELLGPSQVK